MKKLLSLIIVMMMLAFQAVAQESQTNISSQGIMLEMAQYNNGNNGVHRAPMRMNIEVFYNADYNTIDISYDGDATGEVYLYFNGNAIEYSPELNTSLQVPSIPGLYKIEIVGESWVAQGYLQL